MKRSYEAGWDQRYLGANDRNLAKTGNQFQSEVMRYAVPSVRQNKFESKRGLYFWVERWGGLAVNRQQKMMLDEWDNATK